MTTLEDYAAHRFPEHRINVRPPAISLTNHTVVAEVKSADEAPAIVNRMRREFPTAQVGLVLVVPNESPVVAAEKEDREGPIDLPRKRPAIVALIFAVVVGIVGLLIAREVVGDWTAAIISAVFLAIVAGVVGALLGGAGRYAGDRAWQQQRQGDNTIALLAVGLSDESEAQRAAATLEGLTLIDVRIVAEDGAWHVPST